MTICVLLLSTTCSGCDGKQSEYRHAVEEGVQTANVTTVESVDAHRVIVESQSENAKVRYTAAQKMAECRASTSAVIPRLVELLDDKGVSHTTTEVIHGLKFEIPSCVGDAALESLERLRPLSDALCLKRIRDDFASDRSRWLTVMLTRNPPTPDGFVDVFAEMLNSTNPQVRLNAIGSQQWRLAPEVRAHLIQALIKDEDERIRNTAVSVIVTHGDDSLLCELFQMTHDTSSSVRKGAIKGLGRLRTAASEETLLKIMANTRADASERVFSATSLGRIGTASACAAIAEVVKDSTQHFGLRAAAILALTTDHGSDYSGLARDVLDNRADRDEVRSAAVEAMQKHLGEQAIEQFSAHATDFTETECIRSACAIAIVELKNGRISDEVLFPGLLCRPGYNRTLTGIAEAVGRQKRALALVRDHGLTDQVREMASQYVPH